MTILGNTKIRNTMIALGLDVITGDVAMFILAAIITAIASILIGNINRQDGDSEPGASMPADGNIGIGF